MSDNATPAEAERALDRLEVVRAEISRHILGQEPVVETVLAAILSGGHVLLLGLPGLGKTRLVEVLGVVLGLESRRIQFTPDLLPSDILGAEVLETAPDGTRSFRFIEGPVFCQLLMADEINRASPRTQSALLQAMQEREVTVAGEARALPRPFHVLATQNPLEQEGTYPLPEAQLDRFLARVHVPHPARAAEREILLATTGAVRQPPRPVLAPGELAALQELVRHMPAGEAVVEAVLDLVRACRPEAEEAHPRVREQVAWGPGPRGAQALLMMVRARALLEGRLAPTRADVRALARPALEHRMALGFAARAEGGDPGRLIEEVAAERLGLEEAA